MTKRPRTAGANQRSVTAAASGMAAAGGGGELASAASAGGKEVSETTSLADSFSSVWNLKRGFLTETGFDWGAGSDGAAGSAGAPIGLVWLDNFPGRSRCSWRCASQQNAVSVRSRDAPISSPQCRQYTGSP
jgi:hypothetical protein